MTPAEKLAKANGKLKPVKMKQKRSANTNRCPPVWNCLLRQKRKALKLTILDIEDQIGLHRNTISDIEYGYDTGLKNCYKLAQFFGCKIEELWIPIRRIP